MSVRQKHVAFGAGLLCGVMGMLSIVFWLDSYNAYNQIKNIPAMLPAGLEVRRPQLDGVCVPCETLRVDIVTEAGLVDSSMKRE